MDKKILIIAIIFLAITAVQSAWAIFNPAAKYCQQLGYQYKVKDFDKGQIGYCIFPDQTQCEDWSFFAGRCGESYSYCVRKGYKIKSMEGSVCAGSFYSQCAMCTMQNGQDVLLLEAMDKNNEGLILDEEGYSFTKKDGSSLNANSQCGNSVCDNGEDMYNCAQDCPAVAQKETKKGDMTGLVIFGLLIAILVFIGLGFYLYKQYLE